MNRLKTMLIGAAALALAACSSGSGGGTVQPYSLSTAPKSIAVYTPSSLVKAQAVAAKGLGGGSGYFLDENRGAYHWVKEALWRSQVRLARGAAKLVLLDSVIAANGLAAGSAAAPTQQAAWTGTWTEAQVAAVQGLLPPSFLARADFGLDAKLPAAGDPASLPAFAYSSVPATDAVNAAYAYQVVFSGARSEDDSSASIQETFSFYWSADKRQFKLDRAKVDSSGPSPVTLEENWVAYDAASVSMAAGVQGAEGSMSLVVKADPASTSGGVFISFSSSILPSEVGDYSGQGDIAVAGASLSFDASGYADSSGGYLDETFVLALGASSTTYYFKESFDGSGRLLLVQSSPDSSFSSLTTVTGVAGEASGEPGDYSGKASELESERASMDASGPAQQLRKEERSHAGALAGSGVMLEFTVPSGALAPAVGETWAVSGSASAFTGADLLGRGVVVEAGHLRAAFSARPAAGTTTLYIAKSVAGVVDASTAIAVPFGN